MDLITISLGCIVILFGFYTLITRIKAPEKFAKLSAMKEKFGNGLGVAIHTFAYTIVPIIFGGILINAGINGVSLMQFIAS